MSLRQLSWFLPSVALCCPVWGDSHYSIAQELVALLSETEICLNSCQDAQSVQASLPQLSKLAEKADDLAARQSALPAPTVQDDMAAADLVNDFATLWQAICKHIDRLQKSGLVTDALRDILKLSPPETSHPSAH